LRNLRITLSALASPLLLCALAACTRTAPPPTLPKEKPIVSAESTASTPAAALSAQDLTPRLLALIGDIHGKQDISRQLIQKHLGQQGWVDPHDSEHYDIVGKLTETWYYSLSYKRGLPGDKSKTLLFQFVDNTHSNADMSPVCVALDDYKQPLIAAGFTAELEYTRFAEEYWRFTRDNLSVKVYLRGKRNSDDTQTCVQMAIIRALS
jgi:hypothetical protein